MCCGVEASVLIILIVFMFVADFFLSFQFKVVGGGATARYQSLVHKRLVVMLYSEVSLFCLSFKVKVVGGGPTASHFCDSLRSPYGTPFRRAAKNAVLV